MPEGDASFLDECVHVGEELLAEGFIGGSGGKEDVDRLLMLRCHTLKLLIDAVLHLVHLSMGGV